MKKEVKRGTYRIEFEDGSKMVFGNNYKPWWQHAVEYIYRNYGDKQAGWRYQDVQNVIKLVEYSNQQFYDDGGLKWCDWPHYQEVVDDVCKQQQLAPVRVEDIVFSESVTDQAILTKELKKYW